MGRYRWLASAALLLYLPCATECLRVHGGSLDTLDPWVFVQRFCFVPTPVKTATPSDREQKRYGYFAFKITYPRAATPKLLLYFDGFDKWKSVYESRHSCTDRKLRASETIDLSTRGLFVNSVTTDAVKGIVTVKGGAYFRAKTNTWFFIVFSNCADACYRELGYAHCQAPLVVDYDFDLTNGDVQRTEQFSADEIGTLPLMWSFFIMYVLLAAWCAHLRERLRQKRKFHHTVAMLCWGVWISLAGSIFGLIHFALYAKNGVGSQICFELATFLWHAADLLLLLLLILLAKGWTIVRRKISINGRVRIAIYMTFFVWATVLLEIWEMNVFDPALLASRYESPPGYVLVALRAVALVWFVYACKTTLEKYRSKIGFYRKFLCVFGLWLAAKPTLAVAAAFVNDNTRTVFQLGGDLTLLLSAHLALAIMYYPDARCNKAFPFHANTSTSLSITAQGFAAPQAEGDYDGDDVRRDEDAGVDVDTGMPLSFGNGAGAMPVTYAVTRQTIFRRISTAGGHTARLMRTMAKISTDLDRALLDLQGEIECDVNMEH
ncbi:rhodopsin-like GPCR transmembrane domain-containing protein [Pelagophyceae sp. CCMP2097]|nr:rhodopsin-like GPCR transmembrane domain-containing protein [Pelagophyceae sp. CCMP2097]